MSVESSVLPYDVYIVNFYSRKLPLVATRSEYIVAWDLSKVFIRSELYCTVHGRIRGDKDEGGVSGVWDG